LLENIYKVFETEVASIDFACHKGCSTCCTQSVMMTTAEGRAIMDILNREGRQVPELPDTSTRPLPTCTTNGLAACYLEEKESPPEGEELWVYEPCVFLEDGHCTIYPVRPFSCRSFGSISNCAEYGTAEAPDWFITLNTVVSQLIEHLDRGGWWGNMIDVLRYLESVEKEEGTETNNVRERLLATETIPGLLVMTEDMPVIDRFLTKVADASKGDEVLHELVISVQASLPGIAGP